MFSILFINCVILVKIYLIYLSFKCYYLLFFWIRDYCEWFLNFILLLRLWKGGGFRGGYGVVIFFYENVIKREREGGEKDEWEMLYFLIYMYVLRCKLYNMF